MTSKTSKNSCIHHLKGVELLENRCMLSASPLEVGAVYYEGTRTEEGSGIDTAPDYLYVAFQGGAENTEMSQVTIDLARYGESGRYNFIDQGQGTYGSIDFKILAGEGFEVTNYEISENGTLLTIDLSGFTAGDVLMIQWDVDEVLNPDGDLDAESTGAEFAATSNISAVFENAYYEDAIVDKIPFRDVFAEYYPDYDIAGLPNDSYTNEFSHLRSEEMQDVYTAGAFASQVQIPLPCTISGNVYEDADADKGLYDASEDTYLAKVQINLYKLNENGIYELCGTTFTDENGHYSFDVDPGTYRVLEVQPNGYKDVTSFVGTIDGTEVGTQISVNELTDIEILGGQDSIENNFSEYRTCEISGIVWLDEERNDVYDDGELLLEGVQIDLRDAAGTVIATTYTDEKGYYEFIDLMPGTYSVYEHQPTEYLNGGQQVGSEGGAILSQDLTGSIQLVSGDKGVHYDFWEYQYAQISGYVFKDGEDLKLTEGDELPENLWELYPGIREESDTPIANVTLILKDADGKEVARTTTDSKGYYVFKNVKPGNYSIYEVHPEGYKDGIDTPGSLGGSELDPDGDTLSDIEVNYGDDGVEYNFSEIRVEWTPKTPEPTPEPNPTPGGNPHLDPTPGRPNLSGGGSAPVYGNGYMPHFGMSTGLSLGGGMGGSGSSWHLGLLNGGTGAAGLAAAGAAGAGAAGAAGAGAAGVGAAGANGAMSIVMNGGANANAGVNANGGIHSGAYANAFSNSLLVGNLDLSKFNPNTWEGRAISRVQQALANGIENGLSFLYDTEFKSVRLLAGDFNGDRVDELAIFLDGFWFIDLDGNRQWDDYDLWVKLGDTGDQPVVGDWDGDGKADIGVFGRAWEGDRDMLAGEFGLPDAENERIGQFKHIPTTNKGYYYVKAHKEGVLRRDVVDHVFEFGREGDFAVAGDWNGDGVYSIGVFNNGRWTIDYDGDGRFTSADKQFTFGQKGDIPVVGKWDNSEISKVGVYRNGEWILDVEGNGEMNSSVARYRHGSGSDMPLVGDFNGSGTTDLATTNNVNSAISVETGSLIATEGGNSTRH
ncbi:MAG: carboxypeptidase regulatory-like domain-containing protein [Thermoguttaceae bacterium]|nr:carboxypeptidase regulatory-like domain-containing protein [Thermoguttaceae bacterium]